MSEVIATVPPGTEVVVDSTLLTSDVDHTIEEVRQATIEQVQQVLSTAGVVVPPAAPASRSNRTLFCRKCEGHGDQVVLKGHASRCPYNNCQCKTCSNVMSMRANAIIRRYRTRTLDGGLVLKPVHFKNGNTRLRVFPKFVDDSDALPIPMEKNRDKHPSGDGCSQVRQGLANTPPASNTVKRSFSEEADQRSSPKRSYIESSTNNGSPVEQLLNNSSIPLMQNNAAPTTNLLEILLKNQLAAANTLAPSDLLANGLLGYNSSIPSTNLALSTLNFDSTTSPLLATTMSLPTSSVTYTSPMAYSSSFLDGTSLTNSIADLPMTSESAICPTTQFNDLSIGVSARNSISESSDRAPLLTPNMIIRNAQQSLDAEPFTSTLMIAPGADRSHPLFKHFLATVKELEKQMLGQIVS